MAERDLSDILEELLAWTKFAHNRALTDALQKTLSEESLFTVYELSDGTKTQAEVAKEAGVTQPTVSRMYSKWRRLGLLRQVDGSDIHLSRPTDLGLERPTG